MSDRLFDGLSGQDIEGYELRDFRFRARGWADEQETGPPTDADWDWYVAHVMVAQDRPPAVNRQAAPYEGQMVIGEGLVVLPSHNVRPDQVPPPAFSPVQTTIADVRPHSWMRTHRDDVRCSDCGVTTDPAFKARYDEQGCDPYDDIPPGWRGEHHTGQD